MCGERGRGREEGEQEGGARDGGDNGQICRLSEAKHTTYCGERWVQHQGIKGLPVELADASVDVKQQRRRISGQRAGLA